MEGSVTILIKSFNRPYYLERCLLSIFDKISGNYKIVVLDDGTPPAYLSKIQQLYPTIHILRSDLYNEKVAQLSAHVTRSSIYNIRSIPTDLWIKGVREASDIFCMLEDDVWLTQPINVSEIATYMTNRQIVLSKMYWGGNMNNFPGVIDTSTQVLDEYSPELPKGPEWLTRMLLLNTFKSHSILHRLGLVKEGVYFQLPFYALYSVASAMFNKKYWLHLWQAKQKQADEVHQLARALNWTTHNVARFAKTKEQVTETSFISSATNTFRDVEFDVIAASYYLNEAWLKGDFNVMHNYPNDFDPIYLKSVFDLANDPRCTYNNWLNWIARFKQVYSSMGVVVD